MDVLFQGSFKEIGFEHSDELSESGSSFHQSVRSVFSFNLFADGSLSAIRSLGARGSIIGRDIGGTRAVEKPDPNLVKRNRVSSLLGLV